MQRSLERLQVDRVDLIQLHNLVDEAGWQTAFGPGGAVEALVDARAEGLVRFIGVTGHGTQVAAMHRRSLERFHFDSVLLPCNVTMLDQADYRADFDALLEICRERNVAVQTIKSIARRRWREDDPRPKFSWYEPLEDEAAIARAVAFVLAKPGVFLNSSSDARLLPKILAAAEHFDGHCDEPGLEADVEGFAMEPLFAPDGLETI